MAVTNELIDKLIAEYKRPEDILGEKGLLKQLTKAIVERALHTELTEHLGYEKHEPSGRGKGNTRNGTSKKTLQGDFGELEIAVPRDRNASFEPKIVEKHQRRWAGFDDKILSMYARGMTTREIQGHLEEIYGVEVSPALISNVTDAVLEEVKSWQSRPLEALYPVVYLDALYVRMRHEGRVENRAVYVVMGISVEGQKEVLGLWSSAQEGSRFWMGVLTDLKNRGVKDILISCVDGLKGFPEAIRTVYPKTEVQLCIVHMVRNSLKYVNWKERKQVAGDLKLIYRSATREQAEQELEAFGEKWERKYPMIARQWKENWDGVSVFFQFPAEIRKVIYTTNAVESLHRSLRKIIKMRGGFPSEEAGMKLLYLALQNATKRWHVVQNWKEAMHQFAVLWKDRMVAAQPG
ncbi:MAG: IS256 family transposase [Bryobacterales bacterium]|nr:IS256 family transposase [Bryobacterales bacterium]